MALLATCMALMGELGPGASASPPCHAGGESRSGGVAEWGGVASGEETLRTFVFDYGRSEAISDALIVERRLPSAP
jgi:hypothetical protein